MSEYRIPCSQYLLLSLTLTLLTVLVTISGFKREIHSDQGNYNITHD